MPQLPGPFLRHGRLLASLRVWQLMRAGPLGVAANQPLVEAARVMDDEHRDVLVVVDGHGQPVGIITASDPIRALASGSPARTLPQPAAGGSCRCSWPPVS